MTQEMSYPVVVLSPEMESFSQIPQNRLWLFLTTFNRREMASQALSSLLEQTSHDFEMIISDNSTSAEMEEWILRQKFPRKIHYVHWPKTLAPPYGHAERILEIVRKFRPPTWSMFHDDDIALPEMIAHVLRAFDSRNDLSAVGVNAIEFMNDQLLGYARKDAGDRLFQEPQEFLAHYFLPASGVSPCPGYFFRLEVAFALDRPMKGGKYNDIWINIHALKAGKILWLGQPLMLYRRHPNQDSIFHSAHLKFALRRALSQEFGFSRESAMYKWFFVQNTKHHLRQKGRSLWGGFFRFRSNRVFVSFLIRSMMNPFVLFLMVQKIFWIGLRKIQPLSPGDSILALQMIASKVLQVQSERPRDRARS